MEPKGRYQIIFKNPSDRRTALTMFSRFEGKCENFYPNGLCAFSNKEGEMLLVHYQDIIQMKPIKERLSHDDNQTNINRGHEESNAQQG